MSWFLDELEAQLYAAARAQTARRGHIAGRRRRLTGALSTAVAVAVAVAVTVGGVFLLGGAHKRDASSSAARGATVPGRQQLIDTISALRRPQTKADLALPAWALRPRPSLGGTPDLPLVRYAMTTSWGERLYFVPLKPATGRQVAASEHSRRRTVPASVIARRVAAPDETLAWFSPGEGGGGSSVAQIRTHGDLTVEGISRPSAFTTRLILIVPDGVAKVTFIEPRQPDSRTPPHASVPTMTVSVHDNIAAFEVDRVCCESPAMVWYATDGHLIKRVGFSAVAPPLAQPDRTATATRDRSSLSSP